MTRSLTFWTCMIDKRLSAKKFVPGRSYNSKWSEDIPVSSDHQSFAGLVYFAVNRLLCQWAFSIYCLLSAISFCYPSIISISVYKQVLLLIYLPSVMVNYHTFFLLHNVKNHAIFVLMCLLLFQNESWLWTWLAHSRSLANQTTFQTKMLSSGFRLETETKAAAKWTIHASRSENEELAW